MGKLISIIVPCYNVESYISRCMESILNQTIGIDKLEVILVNDSSTDCTLQRLVEYERKYPDDIKVINSEVNLRQGGARNLGMEVATAPYIGFVDSDDWLELDMYEKMYQKALEYNCDIVFCRNVRDNGNEKEFEKKTGAKDYFLNVDTPRKRSEFLASNLIGVGVWDKIYRREIIFDNQIRFLEKVAYEDIHFGAMFYLYAKRIYMLEERLYHYFINTGSTVLNKNQKYHYDFFRVNLKKLEEFDKRGGLASYTAAVEYDFILTYYIAGIKLLAQRFDRAPYEIFYEMQETIKILIPNYLNNPFLQRDGKEVYKLLIGLIDKVLSEKDIDEMLSMVRNIKL